MTTWSLKPTRSSSMNHRWKLIASTTRGRIPAEWRRILEFSCMQKFHGPTWSSLLWIWRPTEHLYTKSWVFAPWQRLLDWTFLFDWSSNLQNRISTLTSPAHSRRFAVHETLSIILTQTFFRESTIWKVSRSRHSSIFWWISSRSLVCTV